MRIKTLLALSIALVPSGAMRRALYKICMGYEIAASSKIGMLTIIDVSKLRIGANVQIGALNFFKGPMTVDIGDGARIGRGNKFTSSWVIVEDRFADRGYVPVMSIGKNSLIMKDHFFDVYGSIKIGDGSWIAGIGSQFWTHGLSVTDRDIVIGAGNYIGSAVRFAPGSGVGDGNIVGLGSVIVSKIPDDQTLISGMPAKVIRSIVEEKAAGKFRFSFDDW